MIFRIFFNFLSPLPITDKHSPTDTISYRIPPWWGRGGGLWESAMDHHHHHPPIHRGDLLLHWSVHSPKATSSKKNPPIGPPREHCGPIIIIKKVINLAKNVHKMALQNGGNQSLFVVVFSKCPVHCWSIRLRSLFPPPLSWSLWKASPSADLDHPP